MGSSPTGSTMLQFDLIHVDHGLEGLGTDIKRVLCRGEVYAHIAMRYDKVVVHINRVIPIEDMKPLAEYLSLQAQKLSGTKKRK